MKIIKHGDVVVFKCEECGCVFSELGKKCYSSSSSDGAHYCMGCPDCLNTCWKIGKEQDSSTDSGGERIEKG